MVTNIIFTVVLLIIVSVYSAYCGIKDGEEEKKSASKR